MEQKPPPHGECPRCHYITPLSGGLLTHHKRLRRGKWLPCPGIAGKPVEINLGKFVPLERPPAGFVDKRASSAPDEPRYVAGVDPGNPTGPAVVIDSVTGEVVYRRKSGAKGVQ